MARITRKKRERSHLPREGWSEWKRALVPKDNKRNAVIKRGRNHKGFILKNFVKGKNSREMGKHCGIYEWRGTKRNQPNRVVYLAPKEAVMAQNWEAESADTAVMVII